MSNTRHKKMRLHCGFSFLFPNADQIHNTQHHGNLLRILSHYVAAVGTLVKGYGNFATTFFFM